MEVDRATIKRLLPEARRSMRRRGERRQRFDGQRLRELYEQETGQPITQEQLDEWWRSELGGEVEYVQPTPRRGLRQDGRWPEIQGHHPCSTGSLTS